MTKEAQILEIYRQKIMELIPDELIERIEDALKDPPFYGIDALGLYVDYLFVIHYTKDVEGMTEADRKHFVNAVINAKIRRAHLYMFSPLIHLNTAEDELRDIVIDSMKIDKEHFIYVCILTMIVVVGYRHEEIIRDVSFENIDDIKNIILIGNQILDLFDIYGWNVVG